MKGICVNIIDLNLFFSDFSRETNFGRNLQNDLHSAGFSSKTDRNNPVTIQKYSMAILQLHRAQI